MTEKPNQKPAGGKPKGRRQGKQGHRPTARSIALELLQGVLHQKQALDQLLESHSGLAKLESRDQGFARMLVLTTLRRLGQLDAIIAACLDRPLPVKAVMAQDLLRLGLTQIIFMDVADHAAVDQTVRLAQASGAGPYKSMINAILRRVTREPEMVQAIIDKPGLALPNWLYKRWIDTFGRTSAEAMAKALEQPARLDISVKSEGALWAEKLGGVVLPTGSIRLQSAGAITALEGFEDGLWWVQDAAAAIPPKLFGDISGKTVIDLCAAPGGKAAALAAQGALVTALDRSAPRMARLQENMNRLGQKVSCLVGDGAAIDGLDLFDGVLLDAPCSATGTIRRHPDTAWLKQPRDIEKLSDAQRRLIKNAATLLKPGGLLVYCTCSLEPEEGANQADFIANNPDLGLIADPITANELAGIEGFLTPLGHIITRPDHWPEFGGIDGFFAARFRKT